MSVVAGNLSEVAVNTKLSVSGVTLGEYVVHWFSVAAVLASFLYN